MESVYNDSSEFKMVASLQVSKSRFPVTTCALDSFREMIWVATDGGYISSFDLSNQSDRYSAFCASHIDVIQMTNMHDGLLSLDENGVMIHSIGGLNISNYSSQNASNLNCMLELMSGSLLLGGHKSVLIDLDINTMQEKSVVNTECDNMLLKHCNNMIITVPSDGSIKLRDPRLDFRTSHTLATHCQYITDVDFNGNRIVIAGNNNYKDPFMTLMDIRTLRPITTVEPSVPPYLLKFVPNYHSGVIVVSQKGMVQVMEDTGIATPDSLRCMNLPMQEESCVTSMALSSNNSAIVVTDNSGLVHLMSTTSPVQLNDFVNPLEYPMASPEEYEYISPRDSMNCYNHIPIVATMNGGISSYIPQQQNIQEYRKPLGYDPNLNKSLKLVGDVGYASNPKATLRNQMPYNSVDSVNSLTKSMSFHNLSRSASPSHSRSSSRRKPVHDPNSLIPEIYTKVNVVYTKYGDDFNFTDFNKTKFSGLEKQVPNAYCNAILQVLYFIEPLRAIMLSHICDKEFCLSCELGFLFQMMSSKETITCQASNFLRSFRTIHEANALNLVIVDTDCNLKSDCYHFNPLAQNWGRFIIQHIQMEFRDSYKKNPTNISSEMLNTLELLFKSTSQTYLKCGVCSTVVNKLYNFSVVDLIYPELTEKSVDFASVLKGSMNAEQSTKAYCNNCSRYTNHNQTKIIQSIPSLIIVNCHTEQKHNHQFWMQQENASMCATSTDDQKSTDHYIACKFGSHCTRTNCKFNHSFRNQNVGGNWVPLALKISIDENDKFEIKNCSDMTSMPTEKENYYDLYATVAHILDPSKTSEVGHLVSHIKVSEFYHTMKRKSCSQSQWYLFNDFSVRLCDSKQAVDFNHQWKKPCMLYYMRRDIDSLHNFKEIYPISNDVLYDAKNISENHNSASPLSFTQLTSAEVDQLGVNSVFALDAEFVIFNQEENVLRSDGTKSLVKPSQMTLARISLIRGNGANEGVASLDDFISAKEAMVRDYVTQYSGIEPGDLDVNVSCKHLTTLKTAYLKMRRLVDLGVTFVGHGLKSDFNVINLIVPKSQIIDTVNLFHLPNQRKISLKFLAWFFLDKFIQTEKHDSIEDARTALSLYKYYLDYIVGANKATHLSRLYERGRSMSWSVPDPSTPR